MVIIMIIMVSNKNINIRAAQVRASDDRAIGSFVRNS